MEEAEARASRSVYRTARVVHAVQAAIQRACTSQNIKKAFEQAHMVPLLWDPPCIREKEEKLLKEAKGMNNTVKETTERQKRGRMSGVAKPPLPFWQTKNSDDTAHSGRKRCGSATTNAFASLAASDTDDSCQTSETGKTKRKTGSKGR